MKLSIIALFGILPVISAEEETCADKIDKAQHCLDFCVNAPNVGVSMTTGNIYGNDLVACLETVPASGISEHLETCCKMDTYDVTYDVTLDCETSLSEAQDCLVADLAPVQTAGTEYLNCLGSNYFTKVCQFGNFCVGLLTDGYGTGDSLGTDFAIGSGSFLATNVAAAETCDDPKLTDFGKSVCDNAEFCCPVCQEKLAPVVNSVMDLILLPTYNPTLSDCGGSTSCADYSGSTRRNLAEMVGPTTIDVESAELATTLASECVDTLATDIVVYNETFAVSNHFDCLSKKMGKIAAEMDSKAQESSSISLSFGRITALSMIASVVYSAIA